MELFKEYFVVLLPVILIELVLMITALVHVLRHPNYRFGNRVLWAIVVVFIQIIGPILYFVFGRGEEG
ncbi:PLD nuclease N-terminal domain-containing protein [Ruminococcus sp. OA3]|uniref:PLD nuclease N-terminal domain-containing protein n=1 Tax=Ruminococcus sp. OA3 TaxID=2914164 RepID=UPI001F063BDE|nr:PLD nuclease N-terminal domain-containing protein [Ruminococcus sp. OA3]MCH1983193.1 PLD nuclease N-terminal domain-containing protein [Ruminococcus sp. OA3]